ncbi:hypothetical protein IM40_03910 [Candidatus Paracaedimonas acanthamoebae]|nr:hypothetical protein IM40_03910 [Candidatus Paracaedimonas acanthamoebae]
MRSIKVLALLISIVSFQPLQASSSTPQQNSLESSLIVKSEPSSKESSGLWGQTKKFISLWFSSFRSSSSSPKNLLEHTENPNWWAASEKDDQPWAKEWSKLVGHVAEENAKQTRILLTQMVYRKGELEQSSDEYYQELAESFKKTPDFIKGQDINLISKLGSTGLGKRLISLVNRSINYLEDQHTAEGRSALIEYTRLLSDFYLSIEAEGIDDDHFDQDLFQQGYDYKNVLVKISKLKRHPGNLASLKKLIKDLYIKLDGGRLSELSHDTLSSLGIEFGQPHRRSSWLSSQKVGTGLLFLVVSSGMITAAAAARPPLLDAFCSTNEFNYGTCETSFSTPIGFDTEIASLKSNSFFQDIITNTITQTSRSSSISDTLDRLSSIGTQFYGEIITARTGSFSGGNVTSTMYFDIPPYLGMRDAPISSTQYDRITFNMTAMSDTTMQTINSYTRTGPMGPSYYGQIPNSERMILAITDVNQTWPIYGVVIDRPSGGVPTIIREGIITSTVQAVYPDSLSITPVNNVNPNGLLPVESVDSFVSSLYSGQVAGPDGLNPRPIAQYLEDIGFSTSSSFLAAKNCLESPGVSPLACSSQFAQNSGFTTALYVYATQPNSVVTLSRNLLQGTNYTEGTYQAGSGNVLETLMSYTWNPALGTAMRTNSTLPIPFSTLRGTLPLNQIEKIWIYNPDPANSELGYVVRTTQNASGTATSYYVVPGEGITTFVPTPSPTPTSSGPTPTDQPSSGPSSSGLSETAKIGIGVGAGVGGAALLTAIGVGVGCGVLKHKIKKSKLKDLEAGNNDIPLGPVTRGSTVTRENFAPTGKGIVSGISVTGTLNKNQYVLFFTVTEEEFDEIVRETGLKMQFTPEEKELKPGEKPKMNLILGGGNFGQVRIAKDLQDEKFVAVKIISGNEKVKSSRREGDMQYRLRDAFHVLPLDDYLYYAPSTDRAASTKLRKKAFGNTDHADEDLLLQFTPLATLGSGESLSYYLSFLKGKDDELRDKIVAYVGYCLLTGLLKMHHSGIAHLDVKLDNLLLSWDGDVWVADMGCAVQKTILSGGIGDFRNFDLARLEHLRHLGKKKKGDLRATFNGHASDNFAAGLAILHLILGEEHPFQELFDPVIEKRASIPNYMLNKWTQETYEAALEKAFGKSKNNDTGIFKVIRGLTFTNPQERWSTEKAQKALEKLLPEESGKKLFSQFEKRWQQIASQSQQVENPEEGSDLSSNYLYKKEAIYYHDILQEENHSSEFYGKDLSVYETMQKPYEEENKRIGAASSSTDVYVDTLEKPEGGEPTTYTIIPDEEDGATYTIPDAFKSSPPPRRNGNPSNTPNEWVYQ